MRTAITLLSASLSMAALIATSSPAAAAGDATDAGLLAAIGLNAASAKTQLNAGGGEVEIWMLSSQVISTAAAAIGTKIEAARGARKVIILTPESKFNLGLAASVQHEIAYLRSRLTAIRCPDSRLSAGGRDALFAAPTGLTGMGVSPTDIAAAITGALKTDTDISGVTIDPNHRTLMSAVAGRLGANAFVPSDSMLAGAGQSGSLAAAWTALSTELADKRSPACAKSDADKAVIAEVDAARQRLSQTGPDGGPSLLQTAVQSAAYLPAEPGGASPLLLTVAIEHAGGSVLVRSNIWTQLGASAVGISGGLVISYRLTDPVGGEVKAAGLLVCGTAVNRMRDIHRAPISGATCALAG